MIKPGATEKLAVYLSSTKYSGPFSRRIRVQTNDPNHPNETLTCEGRVLVPLIMDPKRVNFGRVARDAKVHNKTVNLVRGDGGPIAPEVLPFPQSGLNAKVCEIEPGELYELEITLEPPYPNESIRQMLRVKTGVEDAPQMTLYVAGSIVPRLQSTPSAFTFPTDLAEGAETSVRLRWADGRPANITEVTSNIPEAIVRLDESGKMQQIVMTLPAGAKPAGRSKRVTVKTDDPEVPTFTIPVRFHAKAGSRVKKLERSAANLGQAGPVIKADLQRKKPAPTERKMPASAEEKKPD